MSETQVQPPAKANSQPLSKKPMKEFFESPTIQDKFKQLLGQRATGFITSVMQVVNSNQSLVNVDPVSVYNSACMAAILDLPINQNLGFAWIVPYKGQAAFQMGALGYVQLAQRTGQYLRINAITVYESQLVSWNSLTEELVADFTKPEAGNIVGFCAYFKLINGFEKTIYWPLAKVEAHGKRYSKTYNNGPWKDEFNKMAEKTVLKSLLKKWGPLSIEIQKAIVIDQAVIKNDDGSELEYADSVDVTTKPDVDTVNAEKENLRIMKHIAGSKTLEKLQQVEQLLTTDEQQEFYIQKEKELNGE